MQNAHLLEVSHALLFHMRVPKSHWSDVVLTACHLINRMSSIVLGGHIPYTYLSPNAPLFHLPPTIFGCVLCSYLSSQYLWLCVLCSYLGSKE